MAHFEANSVLNGMEKQVVDHITTQDFVTVTSIKALAQGYILNCRCEGKSPKTINTYEEHLKRFIWFCQQQGYPDEPQLLTVHHIRGFLWYIASEPTRWGATSTTACKQAGQATVNHYYRVLNTFFRWLERETLLHVNPFVHLKTPKIDKKVIQALTPNGIERLFKECSGKTTLDIQNKAILSILLDCGLRVSELASLTLEDIDMNTGSILVRHGKGNKQRVVRVGMKAQKVLWKYITLYRKGNSNSLFLNRSGETFDVVGIKILIKRLGNRAQVKVHPHKLRHTFAISFLRAGGDVFSLQYLLGHSTLQMTQRYLQSLNANDAANAHKKFSPLDNLKL
ncbi:tyrosine-type recombinase/integrase [Chloroflexota bacterium]